MLMNPTHEVKYSGRKSIMEKTELCGSSCRLELEEVTQLWIEHDNKLLHMTAVFWGTGYNKQDGSI